MSELIQEKCVACHIGAPKATDEEIATYQPQIPRWEIKVRDGIDQLHCVYTFDDFVQALAFTNRVGAIAEEEGHHPAITTEWGKVTVAWWTHKIKGLHRNDFIMAAKTDTLFQS